MYGDEVLPVKPRTLDNIYKPSVSCSDVACSSYPYRLFTSLRLLAEGGNKWPRSISGLSAKDAQMEARGGVLVQLWACWFAVAQHSAPLPQVNSTFSEGWHARRRSLQYGTVEHQKQIAPIGSVDSESP